jgi:hypothetical protein
MERFAGGSVIGSGSELMLVCFFAKSSKSLSCGVILIHSQNGPVLENCWLHRSILALWREVALGLGYVNTTNVEVTGSLVELLRIVHDPI